FSSVEFIAYRSLLSSGLMRALRLDFSIDCSVQPRKIVRMCLSVLRVQRGGVHQGGRGGRQWEGFSKSVTIGVKCVGCGPELHRFSYLSLTPSCTTVLVP